MTTTTTICPVCGPEETSAVGLCHEHPVVQCNRCHLMFVGACSPVEQTEQFFRTEHVDAEETTELHYVTFRGESLRREAALVRKLMPHGGRLLDVGTASGFFLKEFEGYRDWQVEGVEPSAVSTRYAVEKFGLNVRTGYLKEQSYDDESFDVVTSLDAFNCHREPNEDLAEIARILKPGGIFAIEIPGQRYRLLTGSGILCQLLFGVPLRLNAGVNFFFYDTQSLVKLVERTGLIREKSFPESMPNHGSLPARLMKRSFFYATALLYKMTSGQLHYAPKEFLIFRKPAIAENLPAKQRNATVPSHSEQTRRAA